MHRNTPTRLAGWALALLAAAPSLAAQETADAPDLAALMAAAQNGGGSSSSRKKGDFPNWKDVSEGYTQVNSSADGARSLYGIWVDKKKGQMLAELPSGYASQKHYIALTVPTGEMFAGLQAGDMYVYWKRFDKRVALMAPDTAMRSTGDQASKDSMANHYVDRVVIDVPIVCMGPSGQPVIDMDDLLVGKARTFYGSSVNKGLSTIAKAKAFPKNVELAFTGPTSSGKMQTFHYSISKIESSPGYKPREADDRLGYFMTTYRDLGKFRDDEVDTRYINRWHLEKADKSLALSPPKQPITYYIEHTVPIRYRRWVKAGVEMWNDAYEKIGISDAIVVHYQDKASGSHMDKDPEDVRYNFIRWLSNDIGTAIGPSRAHPITGEILDADVVLTDGWIRHFWYLKNDYLPQAAMSSFNAETLEWFARHPDWDPRVRLAAPHQREAVIAELAEDRARAVAAGLNSAHYADAVLADPSDMISLGSSLGGRGDHLLCMAADGKAREMAIMGLTFQLMGLGDDHDDDEGREDGEDKAEKKEKKKEVLIDGIPESFVGPMLADLVAHEVGHTLGLRHNFKASSLYTLAEMNSPEIAGSKPFAGSVMDYIPVNYNFEDGEVQGDWAMIAVGPYDEWVIEYGYGFGDPAEVAKRAAEPGNAYSTDFDTSGPDPLARRYDFAKDPMAYAESRVRLAKHQRDRILEEFVQDGQSWGRARRGYDITLSTQVNSLGIMANWIGGAFVHKDHKGDPDARKPLVPVSAEDQRAALAFVIEHSFHDEAFGLTPELLQHMTIEKYGDSSASYQDSTYPIHDRVAGVQASVMSMVLNPTTLRRVYDNEMMIPAEEDALTLPELMETVSGSVWNELTDAGGGSFSERQPMISSLRRNLQREHLERLIDLAMDADMGAAPVSNLALAQLRDLAGHLERSLGNDGLDAYSRTHLEEAHVRITKALDAQFIYNTDDIGGGGVTRFIFGQPAQR